ncbi:MAG: N-acetylmuramoyl-L-alanine amidase, partial [Gemmatimonadaceae bacterium]|nr:N-acetylmuramoyl-L-alanine amidase [Gemmatimonadaceae bacterium]
MTIPETNWFEGRDGEVVEGAVCHWTTGTAGSALAHFRNMQSRVSAHYIIDRDGTRIPVLPEADTAYHAGDFFANLRTVGIEFVGGEAWANTFTDAQYAEGARLVRELSARYGFPIDAQHV